MFSAMILSPSSLPLGGLKLLRGWPQIIIPYPGTKLQGAMVELGRVFKAVVVSRVFLRQNSQQPLFFNHREKNFFLDIT